MGEIDVIKINVNGSTITIIPRGETWNEDFRKLRHLFSEGEVTNPLIIGDSNIKIGAQQQAIADIYKSTFKAGSIPNCKQKRTRFYGLCNHYGPLIANGQTKGDEAGNYTFIGGMGMSVNDICAVS